MAGEYTAEVVLSGLAAFLAADAARRRRHERVEAVLRRRRRTAQAARRRTARRAGAAAAAGLLHRLPGAAGVLRAEAGRAASSARIHISRRHRLPLVLHLRAVHPRQHHPRLRHVLASGRRRRADASASAPITVMGDGGFWHNGLSLGRANALFNNDDGVLMIMKNGYTSATGTQNIPSTPRARPAQEAQPASSIENTLRGLGVKWLRSGAQLPASPTWRRPCDEAMTTDETGLKVIIAEGECQLERQRRMRPMNARASSAAGERVVRTRFGVDEDICTGDHSCIRLSGCPSLTREGPSPTRCQSIRWRTSSTAASAAACAARSRTRPRCARRSTASR